MNARLSLLGSIAAMSALGACASMSATGEEPHNFATAADTHTITVTEAGARMYVAFGANDTVLSPRDRAAIANFAGDYLRAGHGAVIMSTPSGGGNANAAGIMAQQTRMALTESGVPYAAIAGATYEASGSNAAPIVLTFTRFEATAPACTPLWQQDLAHQSNNRPWASFGCATQANLAAMIEDPHDLLEPRGQDPRDAQRRSTVLDAYRQGNQTHADRSDDERATVSNAVGN